MWAPMHAITRLSLLHANVLLRQGLVALLERHPGLEIVSNTADAEEATRAIGSRRPHVVVAEGGSEAALDTCRVLHAAAPQLPIVLLGSSRDLAYIMRTFRAGATIYVPPDIPLEGLLRSLEEAHRQGRDAGPCLARMPRATAVGRLDPPVSRREREVLGLIAQGKANKEIGHQLAISENTVRNHIANIFGKLGVKDRTEAAVQAIKRGLV